MVPDSKFIFLFTSNHRQIGPYVQTRLASVYFELYNHPAISFVNVSYDVYMRICDASQIRV